MRRVIPFITVLCVAALVGGAFLIHDYMARKRAFAERTACVGTLIRLRLTKMVYAEESRPYKWCSDSR